MQAEAENTKFALEQKVLELQSRPSSSSSAVSTPASGRVRQTAAKQQQQEAQRQQALEQQLAQQQRLEQHMADLQKQNEELLSSRCATSCESRALDTEAKAAFWHVGCCMTLQRLFPFGGMLERSDR